METEDWLLAGNQYPLYWYEDGMILSNIEMYNNKGSSLLRSAGMFGLVVRKYMYFHKILVRLRSKKRKIFSLNNNAVYGVVSNEHWRFHIQWKAGNNIWLGKKPGVRGVVMNPIDHPHGGGEGKKSKPNPPVSPWGKKFKWVKTGKIWDLSQYKYMNKVVGRLSKKTI
jgi:large subunit ribosomal protein L2